LEILVYEEGGRTRTNNIYYLASTPGFEPVTSMLNVLIFLFTTTIMNTNVPWLKGEKNKGIQSKLVKI